MNDERNAKNRKNIEKRMFRQTGSGSLFQGMCLETGFQSLFDSESISDALIGSFEKIERAESLIDFINEQRIISSPRVSI